MHIFCIAAFSWTRRECEGERDPVYLAFLSYFDLATLPSSEPCVFIFECQNERALGSRVVLGGGRDRDSEGSNGSFESYGGGIRAKPHICGSHRSLARERGRKRRRAKAGGRGGEALP
jgi:hypothetical protein